MINDISMMKTKCSLTGKFLDTEKEKELKEIKTRLYKRAIELHKDVNALKNDYSFQLYNDQVLFWFNVDKDTKVLKEAIPAN